MRRHGITFRTAGMMAVFQQTGRDTGRHGAHFGAVAIHGIEQCPLSIVLIIRLSACCSSSAITRQESGQLSSRE